MHALVGHGQVGYSKQDSQRFQRDVDTIGHYRTVGIATFNPIGSMYGIYIYMLT